jgi:hypothetical protein
VDLVLKLKLLQTSIMRVNSLSHQLSVREYTIPPKDIKGDQRLTFKCNVMTTIVINRQLTVYLSIGF